MPADLPGGARVEERLAFSMIGGPATMDRVAGTRSTPPRRRISSTAPPGAGRPGAEIAARRTVAHQREEPSHVHDRNDPRQRTRPGAPAWDPAPDSPDERRRIRARWSPHNIAIPSRSGAPSHQRLPGGQNDTQSSSRGRRMSECGRAAFLGIVPPGWHFRHGPSRSGPYPYRTASPSPTAASCGGRSDDYLEQHPGPADVALVVEIADSSLADDRDYAAHLYGPAGIPACWIVNINARRVEVYTAPGPGEATASNRGSSRRGSPCRS